MTTPRQNAVLLFFERDKRFLVGKRGPKQTCPGLWGPPSGKIEPGETQEDTVKREAREELGLVTAKPLTCFGEFLTEDGRYNLFWWHVEFAESETPTISDDELAEIKWVNMDEYLKLEPRFPEHQFYIRRYFQKKFDVHTPGGKCNPCGPHYLTSVENDTSPRLKCPTCDFIYYENPKMVVGSVIKNKSGEILLCRRAIEPALGKWTIPAGFLENHESVMEAAVREAFEESGATVQLPTVLAIYSLKNISQIQIIFQGYAEKLDEKFGPETLERKWFKPEALPWDELAFPTVKWALEDSLNLELKGQYTGPTLRP